MIPEPGSFFDCKIYLSNLKVVFAMHGLCPAYSQNHHRGDCYGYFHFKVLESFHGKYYDDLNIFEFNNQYFEVGNLRSSDSEMGLHLKTKVEFSPPHVSDMFEFDIKTINQIFKWPELELDVFLWSPKGAEAHLITKSKDLELSPRLTNPNTLDIMFKESNHEDFL